jgi:predicted O-methyltransferase YrrM
LYFRAVKNIFLPINYLAYLFKAKGAQGIHSPFVFELYNKVIKESPKYYEYGPIEQLRQRMLHSNEVIEVTDFGAGGKGVGKRKIKEIARKSAIPPKEGRLLFRLVNFMQPRNMIEMGTSLGISTLYQYKACPEADLITMEGSRETSSYAGMNFKILKADSIKRVVGDFAETLPEVVKNLSFADYVFFDGNHRKEATLEYFRTFLPIVSPTCVFVFDDIRWSKGMEQAWNEIIKEPQAKITIDLFSFGLVFFNPAQEKQHFVLKY